MCFAWLFFLVSLPLGNFTAFQSSNNSLKNGSERLSLADSKLWRRLLKDLRFLSSFIVRSWKKKWCIANSWASGFAGKQSQIKNSHRFSSCPKCQQDTSAIEHWSLGSCITIYYINMIIYILFHQLNIKKFFQAKLYGKLT